MCKFIKSQLGWRYSPEQRTFPCINPKTPMSLTPMSPFLNTRDEGFDQPLRTYEVDWQEWRKLSFQSISTNNPIRAAGNIGYLSGKVVFTNRRKDLDYHRIIQRIQPFFGQPENIQKYSLSGHNIHCSPPLKWLQGNIMFLRVAPRMHVHLFKPDCST